MVNTPVPMPGEIVDERDVLLRRVQSARRWIKEYGFSVKQLVYLWEDYKYTSTSFSSNCMSCSLMTGIAEQQACVCLTQLFPLNCRCKVVTGHPSARDIADDTFAKLLVRITKQLHK
ncbi:hypothetical protein CDAR_415651 [Caerostris darwini]|uniref:Uncharacterized protein n=1 Tax=Caerostris darwini TaxID=1538125 RepID=A0AAV4Q1P8_9ARAC|nr:hypothetical protein CDAR_415651 [Caerostris darwini]